MTPNPQKPDRIDALLAKTANDSRRWTLPEGFSAEKPVMVSFLNAHGINTAVRNSAFYNFLMDSDFLLRDGIGVRLALKLFNLGETENLNGTDLITVLIHSFRNKKLAIFGASDAAISSCRKRLESEGVSNIVAAENGFHADDFYLKLCEQVKPDYVVLCMGMPRQELLAARMKERKSAGMIVCGGGWADFYSGVKIRAPEWVRKLSLEWLHRLVKEPKRLGKRYTVDILYYFFVIFRAKARKVL